MTTIYLAASQVPAQLRGGYSGTKFEVIVRENVHIPVHAGLWSGGSRETYNALRVADGAAMPFPGQASAPWDTSRQGRDVALVPGMAVVCHRIFAGKDMGLRFYLHPTDAAPMLPAPVTISAVQALVLTYTVSRKSSYMGKDRYAMACQDLDGARRYGHKICGLDAPVTRDVWDAAKAEMIARGYLNRAGAITPSGRTTLAACCDARGRT
jgi:hypothetical protein